MVLINLVPLRCCTTNSKYCTTIIFSIFLDQFKVNSGQDSYHITGSHGFCIAHRVCKFVKRSSFVGIKNKICTGNDDPNVFFHCVPIHK